MRVVVYFIYMTTRQRRIKKPLYVITVLSFNQGLLFITLQILFALMMEEGDKG